MKKPHPKLDLRTRHKVMICYVHYSTEMRFCQVNIEFGKTYWSDEEPEVYGERLSFDDLQTIEEGEIVLVEDDAEVEPYGGVAARLYSLNDYCAEFDRGKSKLIVVCREDMDESDEDGGDFAMVWRIRNHDKQEIKEEPEMIVTEQRTPPADANLAVTEQYTTAYNLNVKIHTSMQAIQQNLYDMCSALKQMRDGKLYKELGYQNFEEYCEKETPFSRRQAYKYITIMETLPNDFVNSSSQIGVQKMYLLTALTDDQREELTQTVDLESTTVRELKAQIAALQSQNADTEKARIDAEERAQKWYDEAQGAKEEAKEAEEAKERNRLTLVGLMEKKQEQVRQLEAKIKELENQPQDVAVVDRTEEIDRLNAEIAALREKLAEKPDMQLPMNVEPIYQQDTKAVYNAYLRSVTTTLENLCRFIRTNRSDKNHDYFEENFRLTLENAVKSIEEE
jgi:hypothetical protein